jgi:hypothetical protein
MYNNRKQNSCDRLLDDNEYEYTYCSTWLHMNEVDDNDFYFLEISIWPCSSYIDLQSVDIIGMEPCSVWQIYVVALLCRLISKYSWYFARSIRIFRLEYTLHVLALLTNEINRWLNQESSWQHNLSVLLVNDQDDVNSINYYRSTMSLLSIISSTCKLSIEHG